jgi:hypothetical protein
VSHTKKKDRMIDIQMIPPLVYEYNNPWIVSKD